MFFIVRIDGIKSANDFLHRVEREQALTGGEKFAEPSVLGNHRAPCGEIAGAPIAEPASVQPDVLILGDRELAPRAPYVIPIGPGVCG